jgi:hypothetical protein
MEDALRAVVFRGMQIVGAFMSGFGPVRQILRRKQMSAFRVTADMRTKVKIRRS